MTWLLIIKNVRYIGILALVIAVVWFYKDYKHKAAEVVRVQENASQERKADSIKYSQVLLTKDETIEELKYNNPELLQKIEEQDIKLRNITRIISQKQTYIDTMQTSIVLKGLLEAIDKRNPITVPFKDSTDCIVVGGNLHFDGKDIKLNNVYKKFNNATDIVAYLEKKPFWKFWKWGKKRKISVSVFNSCGETETKIIDVKRN